MHTFFIYLRNATRSVLFTFLDSITGNLQISLHVMHFSPASSTSFPNTDICRTVHNSPQRAVKHSLQLRRTFRMCEQPPRKSESFITCSRDLPQFLNTQQTFDDIQLQKWQSCFFNWPKTIHYRQRPVSKFLQAKNTSGQSDERTDEARTRCDTGKLPHCLSLFDFGFCHLFTAKDLTDMQTTARIDTMVQTSCLVKLQRKF